MNIGIVAGKSRVNTGLLLLVPVLAQAFFTLVRRHLMSFTFLSARHILNYFAYLTLT